MTNIKCELKLRLKHIQVIFCDCGITKNQPETLVNLTLIINTFCSIANALDVPRYFIKPYRPQPSVNSIGGWQDTWPADGP